MNYDRGKRRETKCIEQASNKNIIMKLTKNQLKVLSDIIYKYLNGKEIDMNIYNKRIMNKLIELNLIDVDNQRPKDVAIIFYLGNIKKNMIFINEDDQKICLDKKISNGWEFIWFMTEGKLGGGFVSYTNLISKYVVY